MTVPKLRFPEFRDAGDWEEKKLGELLSNHPDYGVNAAAVPYSEDLPAYLRITDISDEGYYLCDKKVSVDIEAKNENYLSEGDIVLARTGASVGKSYRYKKEDGKLVFAGFLIRTKPDPQKLDPTFLFNFISTKQYWNWISVNSARSGQPGINSNEYAVLPVPVPPYEKEGADLLEQKKIADCLSSIDSLIAAETQKLETLKAHKKGLMQQLFPAEGETLPKLRFPAFRDAGDWEEGELGKYFKHIRNGFVGTATPYYIAGGVPYLQGKNIKQAQIDEKGLVTISNDFHNKQKKSQLHVNDILMVQSGHVGECALVNQKFAGSNCHALVVLSPNENTNSAFFVHYFYSPPGREGIRQITTGNTIKHILTSDLKPLNMYVPILKEQQKIADCFSSLDDRISAQTQKITTLKTHKKGLMQQLFPAIDEVKE